MTPAAERQLCLAAYFRLRAELAEAEAKRIEDEERGAAILDAAAMYPGALSTRANALATDFADYLSRIWSRERSFATLPPGATAKRRALHRLAVAREGEPIGWRRIYDLAKNCNAGRSTLQEQPCESFLEGDENGRSGFSQSRKEGVAGGGDC